MDFEYEGSGEIRVGGCSGYKLTFFLYYEFAIGSTVYSKPKARKGIYEKVTIKDVRFPSTYADSSRFGMCKFCSLGPLYVDTFNAYWNEEELVSYSDATELIEAYLIQRGIWAEDAAHKCKL